jgi:amino acid transporter
MPRPASGAVSRDRVRVVLATTVLLSFISFWRAAAIVLADLGSTAYYVGGIVEHAVGKAAPWFILAVMLFSYAVRAIYMEGSTMFVRGGVYRVVKEAMGGTLAKLSVSALLFDYVLTGPISSVSAGQYIAGLVNDLLPRFGSTRQVPYDATAVAIALLITIYFWWRNTRGLHESSGDALRIMAVTTVMVVILIGWCALTLWWRGGALPPAPTLRNMRFSPDALGWLRGSGWAAIPAVAMLVGFGHSILAMSGEETLAQVYREIEQPKVRNLSRAALIIFAYSLLFTSLVSFFAVAIIPDAVRPRFYDNLISGLAMNLAGPEWLRLIFQAFVVVVGFLILAGAVNTSMVGSNGVMNRISEDGVLTPWFRQPHPRFGTSYRIVNLIAALQLVTILLSRGRVYVLGEAYAFGVVWSFAFNGLSVLVLRFTQPGPRDFRVPLNVRIGGTEWPVGLGLITLGLFVAAGINLFTKQIATVSGVGFTLALFALFVASERAVKRQQEAAGAHLDQFQLLPSPDVGPELVSVRPGGILVPVRNYNTLEHLDTVLAARDDRDIGVMTVRVLRGPGAGLRDLDQHELFTDYERTLFTRVVSHAERLGRSVRLLIVPAIDVYDAIVQTAIRLQSSEIAFGESAKMSAREQARLLGEAWDRTARQDEHQRTRAVIYYQDGRREVFRLGVHAPELAAPDLERIHRLWVEAVASMGPDLHHRDVVAAALAGLEEDLEGPNRESALARIRRQMHEDRARQPGDVAEDA